MTAGERALAAARGVIGCRFRLHGRDPRFGLDCVGVIDVAARAARPELTVPTAYPLRGDAAAAVRLLDATLAAAVQNGVGDVLLCQTGPAQLHLAIASEDGVIHADAPLRRVVERPGTVPWPVLGRWGW